MLISRRVHQRLTRYPSKRRSAFHFHQQNRFQHFSPQWFSKRHGFSFLISRGGSQRFPFRCCSDDKDTSFLSDVEGVNISLPEVVQMAQTRSSFQTWRESTFPFPKLFRRHRHVLPICRGGGQRSLSRVLRRRSASPPPGDQSKKESCSTR